MPNCASLSDLAETGTSISVRVTASPGQVLVERGKDGVVRVCVTCAPEASRANRAVTVALAGAIGVAPARLELRRGCRSRDKLFLVR